MYPIYWPMVLGSYRLLFYSHFFNTFYLLCYLANTEWETNDVIVRCMCLHSNFTAELNFKPLFPLFHSSSFSPSNSQIVCRLVAIIIIVHFLHYRHYLSYVRRKNEHRKKYFKINSKRFVLIVLLLSKNSIIFHCVNYTTTQPMRCGVIRAPILVGRMWFGLILGRRRARTHSFNVHTKNYSHFRFSSHSLRPANLCNNTQEII